MTFKGEPGLLVCVFLYFNVLCFIVRAELSPQKKKEKGKDSSNKHPSFCERS